MMKIQNILVLVSTSFQLMCIFSLTISASTQDIFDLIFKECPKPVSMKHLKVNKLVGRWHVNMYSSKLLRNFQCMETTYQLINSSTSNRESILFAESYAWSNQTKWLHYSELNYYDNKKDNGILSTSSRDEKIFTFKFWLRHLDYYILDTNYKDYMIGFYCTTDFLGTKLDETFYVLTRDVTFDLESNLEIANRINEVFSQVFKNSQNHKLQKAKYDKSICDNSPNSRLNKIRKKQKVMN